MSYENAPSTRLLATHCCACGRALRDAASVEAGMGPDCREKYGYGIEVDEAARAEANRLVHWIAAAGERDVAGLCAAVGRLQVLGFAVLAERLTERTATVQIEEVAGRFIVRTPYNEATVAAWRTVPGRRWDRDAKANTAPTSSRPQLWALLKRYHAGHVMSVTGEGRGLFVIPEAEDVRTAA